MSPEESQKVSDLFDKCWADLFGDSGSIQYLKGTFFLLYLNGYKNGKKHCKGEE